MIIKYLVIYIFYREGDENGVLYSPIIIKDSMITNIHSIWISSSVILFILFTLFVWPLSLLFVVQMKNFCANRTTNERLGKKKKLAFDGDEASLETAFLATLKV